MLANVLDIVALLDDIEVLVDPNPIVPKAEIDQKRLGNVFLTNETEEIGLLTQARAENFAIIGIVQKSVLAADAFYFVAAVERTIIFAKGKAF